MKKPTSQVINSILILVGGAILIISNCGEERNVYMMILGLVFLCLAFTAPRIFGSIPKMIIKMNKEDETEEKPLIIMLKPGDKIAVLDEDLEGKVISVIRN